MSRDEHDRTAKDRVRLVMRASHQFTAGEIDMLDAMLAKVGRGDIGKDFADMVRSAPFAKVAGKVKVMQRRLALVREARTRRGGLHPHVPGLGKGHRTAQRDLGQGYASDQCGRFT